MKEKIEKLSDEMLKTSGVYREYSEKDLFNASFIFMEVFLAKIFDANKEELNQKQMEKLAINAGKSFRQTVKLFTKIDMHDIFKK